MPWILFIFCGGSGDDRLCRFSLNPALDVRPLSRDRNTNYVTWSGDTDEASNVMFWVEIVFFDRTGIL
jgi:hypothetical protein